nr:hypothetical protein [Sulfuritalea hydrogenivorans]
MAEDDEAGGAQQLFAPLDKNFPPAMRAQGRPEIGAGTRHDHAAFVELGQRVAQRAARGATLLLQHLERGNVASIECRLGPGETQPDQRIEQIMQIVGSRRNLAAQKRPRLVAFRVFRWRHKAQCRAIPGAQPALPRHFIQAGNIRRSGGKPGLKEGRERMKARSAHGHCFGAEVGAGGTAAGAS